MKTAHRIIAAALLLGAAAPAGAADDPSADWMAVRKRSIEAGLDAVRVDGALGQCRRRGLSAQEAEALLRSARKAAAEALPADGIVVKIEEGLAKQAEVPLVARAAERRLECLRQADRMVMAARPGRGGEHRHLVVHVCMALESGLPAEVVGELFRRAVPFRHGRLIHLVEAGETLHLAGLEPPQTLEVLADCLDRGLGRAEIGRAVNHIIAEIRRGRSFDEIHAHLWIRAEP